MISSRLTRRSHLSPYLRTLQNASLESRCLSIVPEGSSYKFINFKTGIQHNLTCTIRLSMFKHKFSTKSFRQCYRFSAFASQHVGRSCSMPSVRQFSSHASKEQKSRKMLFYLTGLVFAMVGSTYAAVPLYRRFCQATGYGGTVQRRETVEEKIARHDNDKTVTSREIVVQFNADIADGMPWKFVPTQREVRVKPGESALAFYTAENKSSTPITGVSTYNVTPMKILNLKVTMEGTEKHDPFNEGSILWLPERRMPLGLTDDIFGLVRSPYYVVRYNSASVVPVGIRAGTLISFVPKFGKHVPNNEDLCKKGNDASCPNYEELSDEVFISYDEKGSKYKRKQRTRENNRP